MEIIKEFLSDIEEIKNDKEINSQINYRKEEIDNANKKIKEIEKEIKDKHKKEFNNISKIRKLIEDEENYENQLICNKLLSPKEKDINELYKELYNDLEKNTKFEIENREKINNEILKIEKMNEEILELNKKKYQKIAAEMEKSRYKLLINFGHFLYDYDKNKKLIDIINEKIKKEK